MPFHMHFTAADLMSTRFAISPLWETQEAIRTLRTPARQGYHLPWMRQVRTVARTFDLSAFELVMPRRGPNPDFLCPPPDGVFATIDEELARVRGTDPAVARADLTRALEVTPGAAGNERARALLDDPARTVDELAELMARVWDTLLAPFWPRMRAVLEADVAFHSRRLADGGPERLFADLHPKVRWAAGTLTVDRRPEHVRTLDGAGLLLVPSVFVRPDVVSGFDPPWQPTLVYPARGTATLWSVPGPASAEPLIRLLGPNRAAILTHLDGPTTTSVLARRHELALSSVSAHLSVLRDAGLLTSYRAGHRVLYERTPLGLTLATGGG